MKLLLCLVLLLHSASVFAAPKAKTVPKAPTKVRWEYAFVRAGVGRPNYVGSATAPDYGAQLQLQQRAPIFLPYAGSGGGEASLLDIFNRLGSQGWELVSSPGYAGGNQYIFKRRK